MVPPFVRTPETETGVSSITRSSMGMLLLTSPFQPYLTPRKLSSYLLPPYFTIARIAALSPGQSPPPVSTPIFIAPPSLMQIVACYVGKIQGISRFEAGDSLKSAAKKSWSHKGFPGSASEPGCTTRGEIRGDPLQEPAGRGFEAS